MALSSPTRKSGRVTTLSRFAGAAIDYGRRYTGAAERADELAQTVAALRAATEITRVVA